MKHTFLLFTLSILIFTSCESDDDRIWDFTNYSIDFTVVNSSGDDLLNTDTEGNILENYIIVEYQDTTYQRTSELKANMPKELALRTTYNKQLEAMTLSFGEFSPTKNYRSENFTIDWGDGTKDVVKFDLYITWKKKEPTVHKAIYINNELYSTDSFVIKIVKE